MLTLVELLFTPGIFLYNGLIYAGAPPFVFSTWVRFERKAMDYPLLNFILGLGLSFTLVINIGLRVLLSKEQVSVWLSSLSWVALTLNVLAALYIEILFLRLMTPAFNQQIGFAMLLIGSIGALVTASFSFTRG